MKYVTFWRSSCATLLCFASMYPTTEQTTTPKPALQKSADAQALAATIEPKLISHAYMASLDDLVAPLALSYIDSVIEGAQVEKQKLAMFKSKMQHLTSKQGTSANIKVLETQFLSMVVPLLTKRIRGFLGLMHNHKWMVEPLAKLSLTQHGLKYDATFVSRFFSGKSEIENFYDLEIKSIADLEQVSNEFLMFGGDLMISFSPITLQKYAVWKQEQHKEQQHGQPAVKTAESTPVVPS